MGGKKSDSAEVAAPKVKAGAKGDLPPEPAKPNREDFDKNKKDIDAKIEEYRKQLTALTDQISGCTVGKDEFDQQKEECFTRLQETRNIIDELKQKKDMLQDKLRQTKTQAREAQQAEKQLRNDLKELNEVGLDEAIMKLERRMMVESLTLNDEKKIMQEIKVLKAKRPEVQKKAKKIQELEDLKANGGNAATSADATKETVEEELGSVRAQLEEWINKRDQQKEDIQALRQEREKQTGPIKDLIEKRNVIKQSLTGEQNKMKELWDDFKGAQRVYNEWDKKRREAQRAKQEEERARADELWQAQKAKEELEKGMEKPYFEELTNLEQTIAFCKGFLQDEDDVEKVDLEAEKKEKNEALSGFVSGAACLVPKNARDEEMFFVGSKGKKGKKNKTKETGQKAKAKGITHTAATFQMFSQLKVPAPMTVDEIPGVIVKLNAALDEYKDKIADWETEAAKRQEELKEADEKIKRLEAEEAALKEARKAEHKAAQEAEE